MATKKKTAKKSSTKKTLKKSFRKTVAKKKQTKKAPAKKSVTKKSTAKQKPAAKTIPSGSRRYVVRSSDLQGRGVFAQQPIAKGDLIGEYTGERITEAEADRRYPFNDDERHHTFLFRLDNEMIIDAEHGGAAVKYINHSCDPNCEAVEEDDRIFIYALKNIKPGTELAYDYNFILEERHTPKAKAQYPCYCGSKKCRGTILAKK